jgi:6-phosphogluconolactonase (cycloisomerase 2 family)
LQVLLLLFVSLVCVSAVGAQSSPQQYVYASASSSPALSVAPGFSKAGLTGVLNLVPGSPFNERFEGGLVAIDGQGKFLFVLNPLSNDISMFQISQGTGALSEVPASPFQVPPTINPSVAPSQPISIATEKSGKFLFVGYYMSGIQGSSAVVTLAIDTSGLNPVLLTTNTIETTNSGGAPAQLLTDPKGLRLYVGLSRGQNGLQVGGAEVYSIDAASGALGFMGFADRPPAEGHSVALDPLGRFFFVGWGGNIGAVDSCVLSPVDGTAVLPCVSLQLALDIFPDAMVAENSGKFLYGTRSDGTVVYSIDQTTGALSSVLGPISAVLFSPGSVVADPMGPFIYSVSTVGVHVFQVDQQSGNLVEISGSPFNAGMSGITRVTGLAISSTPIQAVSGPAATIFPSTGYSGGTVAVGSSGQTGLFSLVNTGGQNLSITSISISGPNVSSFSQSNTCGLTLTPNANCSISINFIPASAGALSATLQVADNAPGSPQAISLSGTGLVPAPAVTFVPGSLDFGTVTQGTSSTPMNVTVTNQGTAALHIANVAIGGANAGDFSFSDPACGSAIPIGASCIITVTFKPLAAGLRTASVGLTDDAPGSPQVINVTGNAIAAPSSAVAVNPSSPDFGTATQGTSTPMNVTLKNIGTAPLHISSVALGGANGNEFSFSDPTCNSSIPVSGSCTIALAFMPSSVGAHAASLTLTDDAPDSPQVLAIKGMANPAFVAGAAQGGSTTATVTAGQTAQYQLQFVPGAGYSGTVSLVCSGAPLAAVCQAPASVAIASGTPVPFTVTVSTKGAGALPPSIPRRFLPPAGIRVLPLLAFALILAIVARNRRMFDDALRPGRLAWSGALTAILLCSLIDAAGCGGSSVTTTPAPAQAPPPPPIITPSGTSTITITMTAMSLTQQPLQLQPLPLTLTVK